MSLVELISKHRTDKGHSDNFGHNYVNFYQKVFEPLREKKLNILEIGVLFGDSLKLWQEFFSFSEIYGIDNFQVRDGHQFHGFKPVENEKIIQDLSNYERINFFDIDCENEILVKENFDTIKFDIIIDDASHEPQQQKNNYKLFSQFMNNDSMYICEDVRSYDFACELSEYIKSISPNKIVEIHEFNVEYRSDDRLIFVYG